MLSGHRWIRMRSELFRLTQALERGVARGQDDPSILGPYEPVGERPPASKFDTDRSGGHRDVFASREYGIGKLQFPNHLPNNGTHPPYIPHVPAMIPNHETFDLHQPLGVGSRGQNIIL
jgi:hypothetical protein